MNQYFRLVSPIVLPLFAGIWPSTINLQVIDSSLTAQVVCFQSCTPCQNEHARTLHLLTTKTAKSLSTVNLGLSVQNTKMQYQKWRRAKIPQKDEQGVLKNFQKVEPWKL